jgi:hypothetical protein
MSPLRADEDSEEPTYLISLRNSMDRLEASQALFEAAANAFTQTLDASGDYVVEVNKRDAEEFRESMQALATRLAHAEGPEHFRAVRTEFTEKLKKYREKAHQDLQRLHQEMNAATRAVETFAAGVASGGVDHEKLLKQEFDRIDVAMAGTDLERIRTVVRGALHSVRTSYANLRNIHNLIVAQMRDEIRTLQDALEANRKNLAGDAGGVWEKERFVTRLENLLARDRQFSAVVAGLGDLAALFSEYSRPLVDHVLKETLAGLAELVGKSGITTQWEEGVFVAILEGPPPPALDFATRAEQNLSGRYILRQNGAARTIRVDAKTRTVDHIPGDSPQRFFADLETASKQVST